MAVALVAMGVFGSGFAAAFTFSSTTVTGHQGATTVVLSSTAWTGASVIAGMNGTSGCTASSSGSPVAVSSATVVNVYLGVESTPACGSGDFVEEVVFTASVPASQSAATDHFSVSSTSSAGSGVAANLYVSVSSTTAYTAQLDVFLDYGASPPASITSIGIVVNGAF